MDRMFYLMFLPEMPLLRSCGGRGNCFDQMVHEWLGVCLFVFLFPPKKEEKSLKALN